MTIKDLMYLLATEHPDATIFRAYREPPFNLDILVWGLRRGYLIDGEFSAQIPYPQDPDAIDFGPQICPPLAIMLT